MCKCEELRRQRDLMDAAFGIADKEVGSIDRENCTREEFQKWDSRWKASYDQAFKRLSKEE